MSSVNVLTKATLESSLNLCSPKARINTNTSDNNISAEICVDTTGDNIYRFKEISNNSSARSFDEILQDLIETSKNHVNHVQQQSIQTSGDTESALYNARNMGQSSANIAEAFCGYDSSFSQPTNSFNVNNSISFSNNVSANNYEHLIETVYDDNTKNENFETNIVEADSTNTRDLNHFEIFSEKKNEVLYSEQPTLPPFYLFQTPSYTYFQPIKQYANQFVQAKQYENEVKVFSPKILSLDHTSPTSFLKSTTARNQKAFSNTMPLPFSVSRSSAFKIYERNNQKTSVSNNNSYSIESILTRNSQETTQPQPTNVFIVPRESICTDGTEWLVEKMYVNTDSLSVRLPPLETKKVIVENTKETVLDEALNVDFSSLDTSNIVIPTIQVKGPLHKERKQNLENLEDWEIIDFEDAILANKVKNNKIKYIEKEYSNQLNIKETFQVTGNDKSPKLVQNFGVCNHDNNIKTLVTSKKKSDTILQSNDKISFDSFYNIDNEEYTENLNSGNSNDEFSENCSLESEALQNKSFKCYVCNKIFKSIHTLKRHSKIYHKNKKDFITNNKCTEENENYPKKKLKNNKMKLLEIENSSQLKKTETFMEIDNDKSVVLNGKAEEETDIFVITNKCTEKQEKYPKNKLRYLKNSKKENCQKSVDKTLKDKLMIERKEISDIGKVRRTKSISWTIGEAQKEISNCNIDGTKKRITRSRIFTYKE